MFSLEKIFDDISKGCSQMQYAENFFVYIKHLTSSDNRRAEDFYEKTLSDLKKQGVLTEKEMLDMVIKNGIWKKEAEYQKIKEFNERIEESISQVDERMAISYQKQLEEGRKKEGQIRKERFEIIGSTAEDLARAEQNNFIVYNFFYKDEQLKELFFENPGDEDEDTFNKCIEVFIKYQNMISIENIKKLSISNFFQIYYPYVESSREIFDVAASKMTTHQSYLLYYAHLFKNILQNSDVPDHIRSDPNAILNWSKAEYIKSKKEKKASNRQKEPGGKAAEKVNFSLEEIAAGALERKV